MNILFASNKIINQCIKETAKYLDIPVDHVEKEVEMLKKEELIKLSECFDGNKKFINEFTQQVFGDEQYVFILLNMQTDDRDEYYFLKKLRGTKFIPNIISINSCKFKNNPVIMITSEKYQFNLGSMAINKIDQSLAIKIIDRAINLSLELNFERRISHGDYYRKNIVCNIEDKNVDVRIIDFELAMQYDKNHNLIRWPSMETEINADLRSYSKWDPYYDLLTFINDFVATKYCIKIIGLPKGYITATKDSCLKQQSLLTFDITSKVKKYFDK